MDLQTSLISAGTFIVGILLTKFIERIFEKHKENEEKLESSAAEKLEFLERQLRSMELSMANLTGKLEMVLPYLSSVGKLKEDMQGFYNWKRQTEKD